MTAQFLTKSETLKRKEKSTKAAERQMEETYGKHLGKGVGVAFLRACMREWGCGAVRAVSRLNSDLADQFMYGWHHCDVISGVLVHKGEDKGNQIAIFLNKRGLAYHLINKSAYWIDYAEVEAEYYGKQ